jgi:hypothetical protein
VCHTEYMLKKKGLLVPKKGAITFLPLISIVILPLEFQLCDLTPIFFQTNRNFTPIWVSKIFCKKIEMPMQFYPYLQSLFMILPLKFMLKDCRFLDININQIFLYILNTIEIQNIWNTILIFPSVAFFHHEYN